MRSVEDDAAAKGEALMAIGVEATGDPDMDSVECLCVVKGALMVSMGKAFAEGIPREAVEGAVRDMVSAALRAMWEQHKRQMN